MRTGAGKLIGDQGRGKIVPCTCQEAVDLLIGATDVMSVLVRTRRAIRVAVRLVNNRAVGGIVKRDLRAVWRDGLNVGSGVRCIDPSFAVIVEVRKESLGVYAGT